MKVKVEFRIGRSGTRPAVLRFLLMAMVCLFARMLPLLAQSCQTSGELDEATRKALSDAGQRYFALVVQGDTAALKQNSIASLTADFSHIESIVKTGQQVLNGAQASVKSVFLLEVEGSAPLPEAEFYCGVFGKNGQTSGSAIFSLHDLPPGKYAVVLLEAATPQHRTSVSLVLQQFTNDWKLGGLYAMPAEDAGHDSAWFLAQAREFKAKGQSHSAWLYYLEARRLISPLPFMSTKATDSLFDESQSVRPTDFPQDGKTVDLPAGNAVFKVSAVYLEAVENAVDLAVKYEAADISDAQKTQQSNVSVAKALLAKYPEFKDAFEGIVARAVDSSGKDYGSLLPIKDLK